MLEQVVALLQGKQLNRETFFAYVRQVCAEGSYGYRLIFSAYALAKDAHREQIRDSGERYFEHPRAVALIMMGHLRIRNPYAIAAALVHDCPEDCDRYPTSRIREELGNEVAYRVDWGNKRRFDHIPSKEERLRRYHFSLLFDAPRELAEWKLPDRLHNLLTLWDESPEKIAEKVRQTEDFYLPLAEKHGILVHELEQALASLKEGKHLLPLTSFRE